MPRQPTRRDDIRFAIICALPLEYDAVLDSLDKSWSGSGEDNDPNQYTTGCFGSLAVVLVLLAGKGMENAASAVASLRSSYQNVTTALVVGICGAVPFLADKTEVLLGDVVISQHVDRYDFGHQYPDGFKPTSRIEDTLGRPNKETRILTQLLKTRSGRSKLEIRAQEELQTLQAKVDAEGRHRGIYKYLGAMQDNLFKPNHRHKHYGRARCNICKVCYKSEDPVCGTAIESQCEDLGCANGKGKMIERKRLELQKEVEAAGVVTPPTLAIHIGGFGTANRVLKSGEDRDRIAASRNVIAFEMEAGGVWDELPSCIVVKGVCDYADSHKPKSWQNYAAGVAASTVKALLKLHFEDREKSHNELG